MKESTPAEATVYSNQVVAGNGGTTAAVIHMLVRSLLLVQLSGVNSRSTKPKAKPKPSGGLCASVFLPTELIFRTGSQSPPASDLLFI